MPVDIVSFGETMLRLTAPHNTRLEHTTGLQIYVGGSESNTLAGLARLGLSVTWLSALPSNPIGQIVLRELRSHGIDTTHITWADTAGRLGTFYVEEMAAPLGIQVYYDRAHSACALIDPDALDYSILDDARMLHLTGITPALGEQTSSVFQRLLARARQNNIPLSFDVNYRAKLWSPSEAALQIEEACQQARILFCSQPDAAELWGFTGTAEEVLHAMAQRFQQPSQEKTLVLTLGNNGSAQLHNGTYAHEPTFPTQGNIRFGSGDAFDAGYLYAYLDGPHYLALRTAYGTTPLALGNAMASLKRCIPGDIAIISIDDINMLLEKREGRRFR